MFWSRHTTPLEEEPPPPRISDHLPALLASAVGYLRARLELVGIEGKEAVAIYGKIIALAIAAVALCLFGYVFLWIGLVAVIALFTEVNWGWITLGVGILHILGTVVCLIFAYQKWGQPVFSSTMEEFRKDQEWLTTRANSAKQS